MSRQNHIDKVLIGHTRIPVVTFHPGDDPLEWADFLLDQGVGCIEITLRNEYGMRAIETLKGQNSKLLVGAGTVTQPQQISALQELQADFMVSPGFTRSLIEDMQASGIPFLPGVSTPGEIMHAQELGLNTLKFFPAHLFGGLAALKTYGQVFPEVRFCPTGGVNASSSEEYLQLNNVFAVGGSWFEKIFRNQG